MLLLLQAWCLLVAALLVSLGLVIAVQAAARFLRRLRVSPPVAPAVLEGIPHRPAEGLPPQRVKTGSPPLLVSDVNGG